MIDRVVQAEMRKRFKYPTSSVKGLKSKLATTEEKLVEAEKLSLLDSLTGVYNRRALNEELAFTVELAKRNRLDGFAVVMLDANCFKTQINDKYNHETGDMVLQIIAWAIKRAVRESDYVARYGGDEFALILTGENRDWQDEFFGNLDGEGKNSEGKDSILLRINQNIDALIKQSSGWTWDVNGARYARTKYPLYLSGGLAVFREDDEARDSAGLLRVADRRMHAFKNRYKLAR